MSGHDPYAPESGDGSFDVESYDLTLDYRVRTNRLSGVAVVNAVAAIPVTAISLDLVRLRATRASACSPMAASSRRSSIS